MQEAIQDALNEQINREFYASYLYLAMAAHFEAQSLDGFAGWMYAQSEEEYGHAMRIIKYMLERGAPVELKAIAAPPEEFGSPLDIFKQALAHEQHVTEAIHALYKLAAEHEDYATMKHLDWFIEEQVEEEDTVGRIVDRLAMAGDDRAALLMLDGELAQRSGGEEA
nr:ferritin [Ardenticatena sp.]